MSLAPGTRLGPYEITGAIGAGGMGEVFRARDTKLNRDVARRDEAEVSLAPGVRHDVGPAKPPGVPSTVPSVR